MNVHHCKGIVRACQAVCVPAPAGVALPAGLHRPRLLHHQEARHATRVRRVFAALAHWLAWIQFSIASAGTRANSDRLFVTSTKPSLRA
jgi:hypothetical protein